MLAGVPQLSDLVSVPCFEHSQKWRQVWKRGIAKELFFFFFEVLGIRKLPFFIFFFYFISLVDSCFWVDSIKGLFVMYSSDAEVKGLQI